MKKAPGITLMLALAGTRLFAGGGKEKAQEIYFLNFKPEIADVYEAKVIPAFEKENPGYKLKVVTAASGTYEQTLKSEQAKSNPPVIFQTNGPVGLEGSRKDAAPLDNTNFYKLLADKSMALKLDDKVAAIPYAVEGYGIIYNNAIMSKYFALPNKAVTIASAEEIKDFAAVAALGTAVVITPVWEITRGKDVIKISDPEVVHPTLQKLYDTVQGIQYGVLEDKHGWCFEVK